MSRAREVFGDTIDVDTFHAALGDGNEYVCNDAALVTYPLVCIDECFQLNEDLYEHFCRIHDSAQRICCLLLCGDKAQMGNPSGMSAFHSKKWSRRTRTITLQYNPKYGSRFKDDSWVTLLNKIRHSKPTSTPDGYRLSDVIRNRRAWR